MARCITCRQDKPEEGMVLYSGQVEAVGSHTTLAEPVTLQVFVCRDCLPRMTDMSLGFSVSGEAR